MPPTDHHTSFLNRISIRRNQVVSMDVNHEQHLEQLELFQKHVSDRFIQLLPPQSPEPDTDTETVLSISWFRKLLDVYLCCESEFKAVLIIGRDASHFAKPPLDRLLPDHLDRTVKALDICNAVTHGIEVVRHWLRLAQIAVEALEQRPIVEGHVKRAKRALNTLLAAMVVDDKDPNVTGGKLAERMWSISRRGGGGGVAPPPAVNHTRKISVSRSLSSSFSKSWSASKQLQAMSTNLVAPRGGDPTGLSQPVYLMSSVLVFVMWTLVTAVPCQERVGPGAHFQLPRHLVWTNPMILLQEKIGEEWKKKEKRGTAGLLAEVQVIEKVAQSLVEFAEGFEFPVGVEKADEVTAQVTELSDICRKLEVGLGPLQLQVRELFHRMVRSRAEVLDVMDVVGKINTNIPY
ncbi:hypothetical protein HanRHA438_Chr13g0588001 [Helianthus annuus]|uniref:Putative from the Czech 'roh' meaning 'corner n=1 Tax=Helianthus annuus TaxID=4232 RepID=A0A251SQ74_HELAN|nr:uncharacterized protein LOC110897823 [Helianthus annuus]KAF5772466.1 hypothetical protein HanXRQr2_Chr13g0577251 [Helianthus annuus]KAJ0476085.1 hypothetical protein HanHA300_Chr13g0473121 [Helianthus annuus]KAJ0480149.1 hypothetical protein HanIR_Chr13g0628171 [Helianthus annuus]KAJ0496889.1 hypothetical protein HanHA89_Chr13g0505001 [Helianthus annuus]KAJ0662920.1 hypothetical protein HanLR1_Chr13g0475161 [Helianthus annuus]